MAISASEGEVTLLQLYKQSSNGNREIVWTSVLKSWHAIAPAGFASGKEIVSDQKSNLVGQLNWTMTIKVDKGIC